MRINAKRTKELIKQTGMTQQEISVMLGKSKSFMGCALSTEQISKTTLNQLCLILRVTPDVLTSREEQKEESVMPAIHLIFKRLDEIERKMDRIIGEERKEVNGE